MSAAEFAFWEGFYRRNGFPVDRLEWATAIGAEYVGGTFGGKRRARELIPHFWRPKQDPEVVKAWFDSLVKV